MPAPQDEGYLAKILVGDGAKDIPVGTLVAIVVDDKDDVRTSMVPVRHVSAGQNMRVLTDQHTLVAAPSHHV